MSLPGSSGEHGFSDTAIQDSPAQLWAELHLLRLSIWHMRGVRTRAVWADYLSTSSCPWATPAWHLAPYSQLFVLLTTAQKLKQCKIPDFSDTVTNSYSKFTKTLVFNAGLPGWRGPDIFHDSDGSPATKTIPGTQPHGTIFIMAGRIVLQ